MPLFLQTISSNIIQSSESNPKDLFIFGGFCLIASIFSKRFIETLGEKILAKVKKAEKIAEQAKIKTEQLQQEIEKQSEDVGSIIAKSTETDEDELTDEAESKFIRDFRNKGDTEFDIAVVKKIISVVHCLKNNNYTFRTLKGIAKQVLLSEEETKMILNSAIAKGYVREATNTNKKILYSLTQSGIDLERQIHNYNFSV